VSDVRGIYHLCCQYMHRKVWVHTRSGKWHYGQIVGIDGRNVYLRMMPSPYQSCRVSGSEQAGVDVAVGRQTDATPGAVIQEAQFGFGFGGVAALSLFAILAITLSAPRFGFGFGGY